ncbi:074R [Invertebrate iridescent virus 6]|uniref:074R n=1 Tax=Invertebrate iridescent virus 6 TaxID=176652 RepID=Q91G34_IIV6|nr:074R [Invertebrate iridescent virus 6]AAK81998.1 074R [Invertebrate iridescent virus 6]
MPNVWCCVAFNFYYIFHYTFVFQIQYIHGIQISYLSCPFEEPSNNKHVHTIHHYLVRNYRYIKLCNLL